MLDWQKHTKFYPSNWAILPVASADSPFSSIPCIFAPTIAVSLPFRAIYLIARKLNFYLKYIELCCILYLAILFGGEVFFGFLPRVFVRELSRIDEIGSVRPFYLLEG